MYFVWGVVLCLSSVSCCALRAKAWSAPPLGLVRETSSQHQPAHTLTLGQHRAHQGSAAPRRTGFNSSLSRLCAAKTAPNARSKTAPLARLTASEPINTPTHLPRSRPKSSQPRRGARAQNAQAAARRPGYFDMAEPSTPTQEEAMNAMFWGVYERTRSYGPPGGSVATLIARSKITDEQMKIVSREMPRLVGLDEKAAEEELRKLGVTLDFWVDPAAAKSKKPSKRKSREVIEIRDSSSDDEDEKPSPAKKAKAADPEEDAELICRPRTTGKKS